MLRITIQNNPMALTFQLEGKLAGPWVSELAECWQKTLADQGRPVDRVDLAAMTSIDEAGKGLLAAMHARGVELVAADCLMKAVVTEIVSHYRTQPGVAQTSGAPTDSGIRSRKL